MNQTKDVAQITYMNHSVFETQMKSVSFFYLKMDTLKYLTQFLYLHDQDNVIV